MGALSLTNPGLQYDQPPTLDSVTGLPVQTPPIIKYFKNPAARQAVADQALAAAHSAVQNAPVTVDPGDVNFTDAGQDPNGEQLPPKMTSSGASLDMTPQMPNLPKMFKPSFRDVTTDATTGLPQPINPAETKFGKLLHILGGAAQGAAAGFGTYNAAQGADRAIQMEQLPYQRIMAAQNLQKEIAQTNAVKQQSLMVNTPYGPMPASMAKVMFPALIRAGATTGAAQISAGAKVQAAQIGKKFMAVPNVGLFDTSTKQVVPGTAQGVTVTPEIAQEYGLPDDFLGKPMSLSNLSSLERAQNQQFTTVQGENGPAIVNKKAAAKGRPGAVTSLGIGNPGMGKPLQVGDANNPGETTFATGAQAVRQGLPGTQSASVSVPKAAATAEVPTKIGDQKVAFTTMIQHAQLLRDAARALNNGDNQTLAGLKNSFKNEFGYAGPITSTAIADAYKGEVSNVINKGHITDTGNEKIAHTLDPTRQNYQTIDSVLSAYQSLAQSKMNMLNQQKQNAVKQSQKGRGLPPTPGGGQATHIVNDQNGLRIGTVVNGQYVPDRK